MNRDVESLYREGIPGPEAVNNFVRQNQFPLVEPGRVTFVYRGQAEAVHLRSWIAGLNTSQPLESLEGSDLWALTIELPEKFATLAPIGLSMTSFIAGLGPSNQREPL